MATNYFLFAQDERKYDSYLKITKLRLSLISDIFFYLGVNCISEISVLFA